MTDLKQGRILIDFYADWCNPCKLMEPVLRKFGEEQTQVKVIKINVDENPEISSEYSIRSIPTLIYLEDGKLLERVSGTQTLADLYSISHINN